VNTQETKIIGVAGANGRTGKLVCESLLSRARAAGQPLLVRGLLRKSGANASSAPSPGAQQRTGADDVIRRAFEESTP
jgi:hypothetical protein